MSVSKILHDSVPLTIDPASSTLPREGRLTLITNKSDANDFWRDFNHTLDDFFSTIHASRAHIQRLNDQLVERDSRIELLSAENAALRMQLEAPQAGPVPPAPPMEPLAPIEATPPELRARRSIWSRLSGLERESDSNAAEYFKGRRI